MSEYDFHRIFEPLEFQDFARDMVQAREQLVFESFAEGKDMGIDGRCILANGYTIILQAKRLKNAELKAKSIVEDEYIKLKKLIDNGRRIDRYIIVFSTDLSITKKHQIKEILSPFVIKEDDIICGKDLNNYISIGEEKYKKVEEKYFKLWIQNTDTLKKLLYETINSPLIQYSKINLEYAIKKAKVFVETDVYAKALKQLNRNKVLIISGEPGVGKTTLANQVALYYYAKFKYDSFVYARTVNDLLTAQQIEGKKIVIFDDFWGSNIFQNLGNGQAEKTLVALIQNIRNKNDYFLILTTREYILQQGLKQNEDLRSLIDGLKLECRITQYSNEDKLRIYYGHLRLGSLTWDQLEKLVDQYYEVIMNKNYNPRVIAMYLDSVKTTMDAEECAQQFLDFLNYPNSFLEKIYTSLSEEARIVYMVMSIMPLPIEFYILEECYHRLSNIYDKSFVWKSFKSVIRELEKTIIRTDSFCENNPIYSISFQNPSIRDFMIRFISENLPQYIELLLNSCEYFSQYIEFLNILKYSGCINQYYMMVMKKAIASLDTPNISFYDKHRGLIIEKKEHKKYDNLVKTNTLYEQSKYGRIYELFMLYDRTICKELNGWFQNKLLMILEKLKKIPEYFYYEDIENLPNLIDKAINEHLYDEQVMIKLYIQCLMKNRMELTGKVLNENTYWREYIRKHKEEISNYLDRYYETELCIMAVKKDRNSFGFMLESMGEYLELYDITFSEQQKKKFQLFECWLDGVEVEAEDTFQIDIDYEKKTIQEINKSFKDGFLNEILPTEIDNFKKWLEMNDITLYQRSQLLTLYDNSFNFYFDLFDSEESVSFLNLLLKDCRRVPNTILELAESIFNYIRGASSMEEDEIFDFFLSLNMDFNNIYNIWTKKQWEEIEYGYTLSHIDDLVKAEIFIQNGEYYRITNNAIIFMIFLYRFHSQSELEKLEFYDVLYKFYDIENEDNKTNILFEYWLSFIMDTSMEDLFLKFLYEYSSEQYISKLVQPSAIKLYSHLYLKDIDSVLIKMMDDISFTLYVDENYEPSGWIMRIISYFKFIEQMPQNKYSQLYEIVFSEKQINIMKQSKIITDVSKINISELVKKGKSKQLGIYYLLLEIWNELCYWAGKEEYNESGN